MHVFITEISLFTSDKIEGVVQSVEDGETFQFESTIFPPSTSTRVTYDVDDPEYINLWKDATLESESTFFERTPSVSSGELEHAIHERIILKDETNIDLAAFDMMHLLKSSFQMLMDVYNLYGRASIEPFFKNPQNMLQTIIETAKIGPIGLACAALPPPGLIVLPFFGTEISDAWESLRIKASRGEALEPNQKLIELGVQRPNGDPFYFVNLFKQPITSYSADDGYEIVNGHLADTLIVYPSICAAIRYAGRELSSASSLCLFDGRELVNARLVSDTIEVTHLLTGKQRIISVLVVHPCRFVPLDGGVPVELLHQHPTTYKQVKLQSKGADYNLTWTQEGLRKAIATCKRVVLDRGTSRASLESLLQG